MKVLVIEDNADLAGNIVDYFEGHGHVVDVAADGLGGLHLAITEQFDAVILDLILPGMDGMRLCEHLRSQGYDVPILMLTARGELEEKVSGLSVGADDYLVKPVALRELLARIQAQVRRARGGLPLRRWQVGDLCLDERTMTVHRAGCEITLTRMDYEILRILMRESPAVVTRARIESEAWGDNPPASDSLRAHIHRLRGAIDRPFRSSLLHTVHGIGYRLASDETPTP
ncbi:response regulator transcription factor [Aquisalimonas lutea]|uniref:response regulator transcription factor n=1 Tax=Aquisalimonas lutea TaxID=1327750 RepID=UPI0025B392F7|nr:response regulator transcription factor [Aquisalimonas lutea]MDN3518518.1 response regulator transcription factor [Aquisalimonas lutea]